MEPEISNITTLAQFGGGVVNAMKPTRGRPTVKPKLFQCDACGNRFADAQYVAIHKRSACKGKPPDALLSCPKVCGSTCAKDFACILQHHIAEVVCGGTQASGVDGENEENEEPATLSLLKTISAPAPKNYPARYSLNSDMDAEFEWDDGYERPRAETITTEREAKIDIELFPESNGLDSHQFCGLDSGSFYGFM